MARIHKGVLVGLGAVLGVGMIGAGLIGFAGGSAFDYLRGEEKPAPKKEESGLVVKVGPKPEEDKPAPQDKQESLAAAVDNSRQQEPRERPAPPRSAKHKEDSLSEKWVKNANSGGMFMFGKENENREGSAFEGGECSTGKIMRVRAVIADNATTDQPGIAVGAVTEPIQGTRDDGTYCVAIPSGSIVAFMIGATGEYTTNRAPVSTEMLWLPDGEEIKVGQPARYVDGIPGVVGVANHHTFKKTMAMILGGGFQLLNNVTRFGQFSSGDVTGPIEDQVKKTLNQPAEVSFEHGKAVEFDVFPVSTPGYD